MKRLEFVVPDVQKCIDQDAYHTYVIPQLKSMQLSRYVLISGPYGEKLIRDGEALEGCHVVDNAIRDFRRQLINLRDELNSMDMG